MTNKKQVDGNRNRGRKEMAIPCCVCFSPSLPPQVPICLAHHTNAHTWCGDEMKGYKRKEEKERGRS
jgi:hypothetical protein